VKRCCRLASPNTAACSCCSTCTPSSVGPQVNSCSAASSSCRRQRRAGRRRGGGAGRGRRRGSASRPAGRRQSAVHPKGFGGREDYAAVEPERPAAQLPRPQLPLLPRRQGDHLQHQLGYHSRALADIVHLGLCNASARAWRSCGQRGRRKWWRVKRQRLDAAAPCCPPRAAPRPAGQLNPRQLECYDAADWRRHPPQLQRAARNQACTPCQQLTPPRRRCPRTCCEAAPDVVQSASRCETLQRRPQLPTPIQGRDKGEARVLCHGWV
jgi:hypothetical protein